MTKLPEPDTKRRRGADGFGETNWQTNCLTDRLTDWLIDWLADWLTVHQLLGLSCVTELCLESENVTEPSTLHGQQTFQSDFQQFQFRRHTHTHSHLCRENDLHMSWPKNKGTQLAHTFSPSQTHTFTYMATISASARLTLAKADKTRARKNK